MYHKRAKTAPDGIYSDRQTVREPERSTRCSSRACGGLCNINMHLDDIDVLFV